MSKYPLEELLLRWQHNRITTEQAIGQILQHLREQQAQIYALQRRRRDDDEEEGRDGGEK